MRAKAVEVDRGVNVHGGFGHRDPKHARARSAKQRRRAGFGSERAERVEVRTAEDRGHAHRAGVGCRSDCDVCATISRRSVSLDPHREKAPERRVVHERLIGQREEHAPKGRCVFDDRTQSLGH